MLLTLCHVHVVSDECMQLYSKCGRSIYLQWIPEITRYCPGIPFIIVGTDTHLREDAMALHQLSRQGLQPVTVNSAVSLAHELNAAKYMECSVKTYHV